MTDLPQFSGFASYDRARMVVYANGAMAHAPLSGVVTNAYLLALGYRRVLSGSTTYDAPSLNDGSADTTTVTVTGAALGDLASASLSADLQGITLTAWVSAADTVSVRLHNQTGGTIDLGSATLRGFVTPA